MTDKILTTVDSPIATIKFTGGNNSEESDDSEPSIQDESLQDVLDKSTEKITICKENSEVKVTTNIDDVHEDSRHSPLTDFTGDDLPQSTRINPFNKEVVKEEVLFPQLIDSPNPESSYNEWEHISQVLKQNPGTSLEENLVMSEDHFSLPEGLTTANVQELEKAVDSYKKMVMQSTEKSEKQKDLVVKLINLRLQLAEAKDNSSAVEPDIKHVVGHRFVKKDSSGAKHYCEKCNTMIWSVLTQFYKCKACGFCVHDKCLNLITRTCPSLQIAENPQYILSICPEKGLASQNYKCAECRSPISYQAGFGEPRKCDYNGNYYCNLCHWNDAVPVPARILHNWDFEPRKVCRASKQFLKLMSKKPVLRVQDINPMLFSFVEELNQVKKLREEILIMKRYFLSCRDALKSKLLLQLRNRQHFVENSDMYSLLDFLDTANDILLPNLAKIHTSFAQHIKTDCQTCQGKGYYCKLCDYREILFPFDNHAIVCAKCSTVSHRHCFTRKNKKCPNCERNNKRNIEGEIT